MVMVKQSLNQLLAFSIVTLTCLFSVSSYADTLTIEQLMQTLAEAKPSHATFVEKKYIALLDEPVESSGELFFTAPDHLEKRTLLPKPEALIADGNRILIERGSKTYYFTTQNMPELGIFINSIRGTLAGDLRNLKRSFQLNLVGDTNKWVLQLVPTNTKIKKMLKHIQIAGFNSQINSIEIIQIDGDSAVMAIKPAEKM
jgi:hypothetical protein